MERAHTWLHLFPSCHTLFGPATLKFLFKLELRKQIPSSKLFDEIRYIPERVSRFPYSFPITEHQFVAVIKNPAANYVDILNMPEETPLCLTAVAFLIFLWALRKRRLRQQFPVYRKEAVFNWQIYIFVLEYCWVNLRASLSSIYFATQLQDSLFELFSNCKNLFGKRNFQRFQRAASQAIPY